MEKNIIKGHRQRLKNRYLENGFNGFSDHEVIELLLFYAIPYKDTKDMAKNILSEVGGISALFETKPQDLMDLCNISEHVAILLTMNLNLYKRYLTPSTKKIDVSTPNLMWKYLHRLFINEENECFYLVCLDSNKRLIKSVFMSRGTRDETAVYIREIISETVKSKAYSVVIAHNHPTGSLIPSEEDVIITKSIADALKVINVSLLDHIIAVGEKYTSFKLKGIGHFKKQKI